MSRKRYGKGDYQTPEGREACLQASKKWRLKVKTEVLTYYGGGKLACAVCSESRIACLTIDHLEGGGVEHRKRLGGRGNPFYVWLKMQGYPEGYMTLCMNCQFVKLDINKEATGRPRKEEADGVPNVWA